MSKMSIWQNLELSPKVKREVLNSGVRETIPYIRTGRVMNHFRLNSSAVKMMDVAVGDTVTIVNSKSDDMNSRFGLMVVSEELANLITDEQATAKLSRTTNDSDTVKFSGGAWFTEIINGEPGVPVSKEDLLNKGLLEITITNTQTKKYVPTVKVRFTVGEPVAVKYLGVDVKVYPLTDYVNSPINAEEEGAEPEIESTDLEPGSEE